jgi:DNA-binding NarL/FixJ family response regulator
VPPSKGLPPGEAASRVTDADLIGCRVADCETAATRHRLTPRQRDVLVLSMCGKCPKEVASVLKLRTGYVRVALHSVVRKLRVDDGMHGVRWRLDQIAREREGHSDHRTT